MSAVRSSSAAAFVRIEMRTPDALCAERAAAEAFAAGAAGLEERTSAEGGCTLLVYAPSDRAEAVCDALGTCPGEVSAPAAVEPVDWSEAWKRGLAPIEVSPRLVVRPSFTSHAPGLGQRVLVIDPGQAFGTGGHESTRLALEWVDALAQRVPRGARWLDVGIGSGVLALAAIVLAGGRATGFDLDPLAGPAVVLNAAASGLPGRVGVFTGGIEALAPGARFDVTMANLLRRELEPVLPAIAAHTAFGGYVVLSGLLASDADRVHEQAHAVGLVPAGLREARDASGASWVGLLMRQTGPTSS